MGKIASEQEGFCNLQALNEGVSVQNGLAAYKVIFLTWRSLFKSKIIRKVGTRLELPLVSYSVNLLDDIPTVLYALLKYHLVKEKCALHFYGYL